MLSRVYGQFLAFLFYRWEVMMRESAILGILGIYTLGFYIDTTSQLIRRRLKISAKMVSSYST
jgi:phosphonate transport system permease protein